MAKRFKQFLLENEIRYDNNDSTIKNIISKLPNNDATRMIIAKFVLYCVEDAFQFNSNTTRNAARNCIDLIRKYINDLKSVTTQELNIAYNDANNVADYFAFDNATVWAITAASYATYTLIYANTAADAAAIANDAAYFAALAYNSENNDETYNTRQQKLNEYKQYLNMLTAKYHHSDENTSRKINQLTQNKPETEQQWFSFLTQIIDELEVKNIIRELPDGSSELHLPFANIHANSQLELIDIISRNERMRDLIYSWFI